ncbi:MAG: hypothetical protein LBB16_03350 [Puniceicoccales bacterium]|nr:hypothetical protein [Puniceicoccales bacterium]
MDSIKNIINNAVTISNGIGFGSSPNAFIKNARNKEQEILMVHMLKNASLGLPICRLRLKRIAVSKKNIEARSPFAGNAKIFDVMSP